MNVVGYTDQFSYRPGDLVEGMISSAAESLDVDVVRLLHGDTNPEGPGFCCTDVPEIPSQRIAASVQETCVGSGMFAESVVPAGTSSVRLECKLWPTLPDGAAEQGVLGVVDAHGAAVVGIALDAEGHLCVRAADGSTPVRLERPLLRRRWYRVSATVGPDGCELAAEPRDPVPLDVDPTPALGAGIRLDDLHDVVVAAIALPRAGSGPRPVGVYNGKIERPRVRTGPVVLGEWAFERERDGDLAPDVSGRGRHGRLLNMPARGMTGYSWTGEVGDPRQAPEQYAAIHFHDDDMVDAGWSPSVHVRLPQNLGSGVYALRLREVGGAGVDHIPFVTRPPAGVARRRIACLLSSFTYAAYANLQPPSDRSVTDPHDLALAARPEYGKSTYDLHTDGSGVCYSGLARPVLNLRPTYRNWLTGAPRHLAADLYLVHWLHRSGYEFDVLSDHDLHEDGSGALEGHEVVLTSSHPEYCSGRMLDALHAHTARGGRLMYLGGNGFYWVTSCRNGVIEVRRYGGTRTWDGEPGERHHSTTGEPGGLWRDRGRPPNVLTGVGMTAQGWDVAVGYRRTRQSYDPEWSWVFEGLSGEVIGDSGFVLGGASGDELDRFDEDRGSPPQGVVLATSLPHGRGYHAVVEDVLAVDGDLSGAASCEVRSDMVLTEQVGGGAVFSVGSISFTGGLPVNGGDNGVAKVVGNVLENFLSRSEPGGAEAVQGGQRS